MTDIQELLKEMREGLEGVTPGEWLLKLGTTPYPECDDYDIWASVQNSSGNEIVFIPERTHFDYAKLAKYDNDAAHIALCNPVNIKALLDYIEELEDLVEILESPPFQYDYSMD